MAVLALDRFTPGVAGDQTWIGIRPRNSLVSAPDASPRGERR